MSCIIWSCIEPFVLQQIDVTDLTAEEIRDLVDNI